jgi:hypothetical protein
MDSFSNEKLIQPNEGHYVGAIPFTIRTIRLQARKCPVNVFFQMLSCPLPIFNRRN